jgi:hypothetical protein
MITFYLYRSDKPEKKYYVEYFNEKTQRNKRIYFGASKYDDMTVHGSEDRKKSYLNRHRKREDWTETGIYTAGFWSRYLLWNLNSLAKSIKDTKERFNINIVNRTRSKVGNGNIQDQKPSAYKSMQLAKLGLTTPTTAKNRGKLIQWKRELWENLTARLTDGDKFYNCGTKGKIQIEKDLPSVCRPSKRVNKSTPTPLAKDITEKQIEKGIKIKQKGQRINWKDL